MTNKIKSLLGDTFKSAHLTLSDNQIQLEFSKKGKLQISQHKSKTEQIKQVSHNREKKRFVDIQRPFLTALNSALVSLSERPTTPFLKFL